jgi:hypothetical protein
MLHTDAARVAARLGKPRPETADLLVFPARTRLAQVPTSQLAAVVAALAAGGDLGALAAAAGPGALVEPMGKSERHWFVCVHGARDARCGAAGKPLVDALRRLAEGGGERVWAVSHIGGHVHAGNVMYTHPCAIPAVAHADCMCLCMGDASDYGDGDWYGQVTAATAAVWAQAVRTQRLPLTQWRGRAGLDPAAQRVLYQGARGCSC